MDAIVAEDIRKSFGDTVALSGLSLSVAAGEVFALVGPNGAGKTTLIRCLTGTLACDAGTARLSGQAPAAFSKSRMGLLPQDFSPPDRLTARELIEYYAGLYDETRGVTDVLSSVGIMDVADTRYMDLSGGEQRRTLVGTAIVNNPDVLFLDEPTTGIDPAGRRDVWGLIDSLADGGTTVFLTTHYMDEVDRLASRVGVLSAGELIAVGTPAELVTDHGGESTLVIETSAELPPLEYPIRAVDRGYSLTGVPPREIGAVLADLDAASVTYTAVSWRTPDLESVYLSLTGQTPAPPDEPVLEDVS